MHEVMVHPLSAIFHLLWKPLTQTCRPLWAVFITAYAFDTSTSSEASQLDNSTANLEPIAGDHPFMSLTNDRKSLAIFMSSETVTASKRPPWMLVRVVIFNRLNDGPS